MSRDWYLEIVGRELGPFVSQQLRMMATAGQVLPSDRVRHGKFGPWVRASTVKGMFPDPVDSRETTDWAEDASPEDADPLAFLNDPSQAGGGTPKAPPRTSPAIAVGEVLKNVDPTIATRGPVVHVRDHDQVIAALTLRQHQLQQRLLGALAVIAIGVIVAVIALVVNMFGPGDTGASRSYAPDRQASEPSGNAAKPWSSPNRPVAKPQTGAAGKRPNASTPLAGETKKKTVVPSDTPSGPPTGTPENDFGIDANTKLSEEPVSTTHQEPQ
jgi:hypothetical protein